MREIIITENIKTIIDDEDYLWAKNFKWYASKAKSYYRAFRSEKKKDGFHSRFLHREIFERLGIGIANREIDHADRNGLNNLRSNLRIATSGQNKYNMSREVGRNGFIGVNKHTKGRTKPFRAIVRAGKKAYHSKYFKTPFEAAVERDRLALKYHGDFAVLNFPESSALQKSPSAGKGGCAGSGGRALQR